MPLYTPEEGDGLFKVSISQDSTCAVKSAASHGSSSAQGLRPPKRVSRKRRRILIPAFSSSGNSIHSQNTSASRGEELPPWQQDRPNLTAFSQLLSALLLTTGLAVLSALDAKEQCLQHETYALLDLVDDDNFQKAYEQASMGTANCIAMFHHIATTGSITFGVGFIGLAIIYCYNKRRRRDSQEYSLTATLRVTIGLLLLCSAILVAQTYNIMTVMLNPRVDNGEEEGESDGQEADNEQGNEDETFVYNNNPFQSLAAVDRYGHVGDNANLYYLVWMTEGLALALVYQLFTALARLVRAARIHEGATPLIHNDAAQQHQAQYLLPATTWDDSHQQSYKEHRALWFQNLYKLRARAGIWVAALFSCLVLVFASLTTWNQVIWPYTKESPSSQSTKYLYVCQHFADNVSAMMRSSGDGSSGYYYDSSTASVPLCRRTVGAWLTGVIATVLCATAIAMHLAARQSALMRHTSILHFGLSPTWQVHSASATTSSPHYNRHHQHTQSWEQIMIQNKIPLQTELVLSFLLSCLLGFNAVFATGVQGPASTVGNLYYGSWISFLLCLRICLGCVEEYHNISDDEKEESFVASSGQGIDTSKRAVQQDERQSYNPPSILTHSADESQAAKSCDTTQTDQTMTDPFEKNRVRRLRGYFFLWIFSTVCACSAYDAAVNQQQKKKTATQRYMIVAPLVVAAISACLFMLCLSKRCYQVVSSFWIGGLLSIVCFGLWFVDLVLTMHSDDSWAVNGIGEIEIADIYYFSWLSIITAGIQMMFYVKAVLGIHYQDNMVIVWVSICKVCFVILGASLHIWHTISANCEFDEIALGAVTYCSRTVLSIVVAFTGMLIGGLVVFGRLCVYVCCRSRLARIQAHAEMLISMFLVLLFGAAVALITGIGGPGQSVGDLYYSTWLAFWVSLGIFVTCYNQLQEEEDRPQQQQMGHCEYGLDDLEKANHHSLESSQDKLTEQGIYDSLPDNSRSSVLV